MTSTRTGGVTRRSQPRDSDLWQLSIETGSRFYSSECPCQIQYFKAWPHQCDAATRRDCFALRKNKHDAISHLVWPPNKILQAQNNVMRNRRRVTALVCRCGQAFNTVHLMSLSEFLLLTLLFCSSGCCDPKFDISCSRFFSQSYQTKASVSNSPPNSTTSWC